MQPCHTALRGPQGGRGAGCGGLPPPAGREDYKTGECIIPHHSAPSRARPTALQLKVVPCTLVVCAGWLLAAAAWVDACVALLLVFWAPLCNLTPFQYLVDTLWGSYVNDTANLKKQFLSPCRSAAGCSACGAACCKHTRQAEACRTLCRTIFFFGAKFMGMCPLIVLSGNTLRVTFQ